MNKKHLILMAGILSTVIGTGCVQTRTTETPRTATEQLLLSTAVDDALKDVDLSPLRGKKVFVQEKYFECVDKPYALGAIRDMVSSAGALLVADAGAAELVVEPRAGALSTDSGKSLVGIPSTPIPIPLAGTLVSPEVPLYKVDRLYATAKIALLVYEPASGAHVHSTGTMEGKAHHHYFAILGYIKFSRTTIPEKVAGP